MQKINPIIWQPITSDKGGGKSLLRMCDCLFASTNKALASRGFEYNLVDSTPLLGKSYYSLKNSSKPLLDGIIEVFL